MTAGRVPPIPPIEALDTTALDTLHHSHVYSSKRNNSNSSNASTTTNGNRGYHITQLQKITPSWYLTRNPSVKSTKKNGGWPF